MTALEKIIEWCESDLPDWQGDAVRRLLLQEELRESDREEMLLMLKELHGLLPAGTTAPKPRPLHKGMVSGASMSCANVVLKAIKDLQSVNKIPDGSVLPFGHQGLTAIYGENGSGKSGYARVLKRACRARDTDERILPNVFGTGAPTAAKATFKLSVDGGPDQEISWEDGKPSKEVLTNITVFDARCARVIIGEKNEATYLPYGAHVFEALVQLLLWTKQQIDILKPKLEQPRWPEIDTVTVPGVFLAGLTHKTTEKEVESAVSWTAEDLKELEKLKGMLAELEARNPTKQAAISRSFKERVAKFTSYLELLTSTLSDQHLEELKGMVSSLAEAEKAVELASKTTLLDEPVAGAGEHAWQILYEAAKNYSTKVAYPNDEFPVVGGDSRCVLCMQELSGAAKERLLRFRDFMEQAAKKKQEEKKKALDLAVASLRALNDRIVVEQHENTIGEVRQRSEDTATVAEAYLTAAAKRQEYCDRIISRSELEELPPFPLSPVKGLIEVADALEDEAKGFERTVEPAVRDGLFSKRAELVARKCFWENRARILDHLAELKTTHKCDQALAAIDTATITRKGKDVVSESLTPQLRGAIQVELEQLGANHLPLNLKPSGSRGETLHQLELIGARSGSRISLTEVLSEGEQRVVALAGFLAEVGLGQHSCPIILDDPVSSLDHRYRRTIAARLVSESSDRQVFVFTHDIAFLLDLREKAGEGSGIKFTAQTVLQQNEAAGIPSGGLPWHAMPLKSRQDHLRIVLNGIKPQYGIDQMKYDREAACLYGLLRETWEASVEEVVFNGALVRHGSEVQTQRLKRVGLTTEQYKTIHTNMSKCSLWMAGHDKSKMLDVHRPAPNEILADIETLSTFVNECKKAGKVLEEARKAALEPESAEIG